MTQDFCINISEDITCYPYEICSWNRSLIIPRSFLGGFETFYEELWYIKAAPSHYITLLFDSFDVGCDTGSSFEVALTDTWASYCNMDKPMRKLDSYSEGLNVRFRLNRPADMLLIEEFSSVYKVHSMNRTASTLPFTEQIGKSIP